MASTIVTIQQPSSDRDRASGCCLFWCPPCEVCAVEGKSIVQFFASCNKTLYKSFFNMTKIFLHSLNFRMLLLWMLALEHSVFSLPVADIRSDGMLLLQMNACENEYKIEPRDDNYQYEGHDYETKCILINQN